MANYPDLPYSLRTKLKTKGKLQINQYGDGFKTVIIDGTDPFEKEYQIKHELLTQTQADTLRTFIADNLGLAVTVELRNENPSSPATLDFYIIDYDQGLEKGGLFHNFTVEMIEA